MATVKLGVTVANPGEVKVELTTYSGTDYSQTFTATEKSPLNKTVEVPDGCYCVIISWTDGYHNISGPYKEDRFTYNDKDLPYYQVLGTASPTVGPVSATFPIS